MKGKQWIAGVVVVSMLMVVGCGNTGKNQQNANQPPMSKEPTQQHSD